MTFFRLIFAAALFFAFSLSALNIGDARYDRLKQELSIDISYSGGCEDHEFELEFGPISETYPMQCTAVLKHVAGKNDMCKAMIFDTLVFDMSDFPKPTNLTIVNERGRASVLVAIVPMPFEPSPLPPTIR